MATGHQTDPSTDHKQADNGLYMLESSITDMYKTKQTATKAHKN